MLFPFEQWKVTRLVAEKATRTRHCRHQWSSHSMSFAVQPLMRDGAPRPLLGKESNNQSAPVAQTDKQSVPIFQNRGAAGSIPALVFGAPSVTIPSRAFPFFGSNFYLSGIPLMHLLLARDGVAPCIIPWSVLKGSHSADKNPGFFLSIGGRVNGRERP